MSKLCKHRVLEPGEVGMRHHRCCHGWKGTIKTEFISLNLEATGTWDFGNAPEEVKLGGMSWDVHVKSNTLGIIKCYELGLYDWQSENWTPFILYRGLGDY